MRFCIRNIVKLIFIAALPLLVSCVEKCGVRSALRDAERLLEIAPDSSLMILEGIDEGALNSVGEKYFAKYALLLTQAQDKNYMGAESDSLISAAVRYYEKSGDDYQKMLSYYYKGRINYNVQKYSESILSLMKAEDAAQEIEDDFNLGLIYSLVSSIYKEIYNNVESLGYAKLSYEHFVKADKMEYADWAMFDVANAYCNSRDYDKSLSLLRQVIDTAEVRDNLSLKVEGLSLSGLVSYYKEDYEQAKDFYNSIKNINEFYFKPDDYCYLGISYFELGNIDSAAVCMDILDKLNPFEQKLKYRLHKYYGNYKEAIACLEYENQMQNDIVSRLVTQNVTETIFNYNNYEEAAKNDKIKRQRRGNILLAFGLIAVVVLGSVIFRLYKKMQEAKLEHFQLLYSDAERERDNLAKLLQKNSSLDGAAKDVLKERLAMLNKFFASYITGNMEMSRKLDREMERLLANKEDFMTTTRLAFKDSHPKFIQCLEEKGLTEWEIGYCCLYAMGLKGKEIGDYIKLKSHFNNSSDIRKKLGLNELHLNLGSYIKNLIEES